jgi:excisionase family DNA binding protein
MRSDAVRGNAGNFRSTRLKPGTVEVGHSAAPYGNRIFDNRKQLMKVAEVLSLLNISRSHLYKLMKCKGLPYLKVDGATRFEQEAVELWLKKGRRNS